jgi:hypothetical protein
MLSAPTYWPLLYGFMPSACHIWPINYSFFLGKDEDQTPQISLICDHFIAISIYSRRSDEKLKKNINKK